jgi:membrane-bound lytic murein transglycosylase MltF
LLYAKFSSRKFRSLAVVAGVVMLLASGLAGYSTGNSQVYVVQPGDSLWAISHHAGLTVDALAAANGLDPDGILPIGKVLVIPIAGSSQAESTSSTDSPTAFCADFQAPAQGYGDLPWLLSRSPDRLALQPVFAEWARHYDLSLPLLEAVAWQESGWQQDVVSPTGAIGVGQIEPGTATFINDYLVGAPLDVYDANDNIHMSAALLAYLADTEHNNRCLTIAAYYQGVMNLAKYGVFPSTQAYVANVEALIPEFS